MQRKEWYNDKCCEYLLLQFVYNNAIVRQGKARKGIYSMIEEQYVTKLKLIT